MGVILTSYGDPAGDHEGYAGQVLDDGTITTTYSNDTQPHMIGAVVAACGCGWQGRTRYPWKELFDASAENLALAEWETEHAIPALTRARDNQRRELANRLRDMATRHAGRLTSAAPPATERAVLDQVVASLDTALEQARALRSQLDR